MARIGALVASVLLPRQGTHQGAQLCADVAQLGER